MPFNFYNFYNDPQWRNEYMLFAHAPRDMDVLPMVTVVRDCEILFSITKDTFDELIRLSEMFEQSISYAADNISAEEESVTTDLEGTGRAINERGDDEHTEERTAVVCDAASSEMMCDVEYANKPNLV